MEERFLKHLAITISRLVYTDQKQCLISQAKTMDEKKAVIQEEEEKKPDEEQPEEEKKESEELVANMSEQDDEWVSDNSGAMDSGSEESIDLDNLPDDPYERAEKLGIDAGLIDCGDQDLIAGIEFSAIDNIR